MWLGRAKLRISCISVCLGSICLFACCLFVGLSVCLPVVCLSFCLSVVVAEVEVIVDVANYN